MITVRTAIALKGKDGVVFAVENIVLSKLYERGCVKRIFSIDEHIGMVCIDVCLNFRFLPAFNPTLKRLLK